MAGVSEAKPDAPTSLIRDRIHQEASLPKRDESFFEKDTPFSLVRDRIRRGASPPQKGDESFVEEDAPFSFVDAPFNDKAAAIREKGARSHETGTPIPLMAVRIQRGASPPHLQRGPLDEKPTRIKQGATRLSHAYGGLKVLGAHVGFR